MSSTGLKEYWRKVRAGELPPPSRKRSDRVKLKLAKELDGGFGPDRGKRLVITVHPDGRLEMRPERSRRSESVMLKDVYRFAIQCRVNSAARAKAIVRREKRQEREAAVRRARSERAGRLS